MESIGVVSGCGCKEVYRFPKTFFNLVPVLLGNKILCIINFSCRINTHKEEYSSHNYEGLHIMLYTRRSTHKRTLHISRWTSAVCGGCRSRSRGRALYRDESRAA